MSVKLRKRKNNDGSTTLYLDIYVNGKRTYEFLKHLRLEKAGNPLVTKRNKELLETANQIVIERARQIEARSYGVDTKVAEKVDVVLWMQSYVDSYKLKDKRNMQGVLNRFKDFLVDIKQQELTMKGLNEDIVMDFRNYLSTRSKGEGAASYFSRFKKIVKQAHRSKVIFDNPTADVKVKGLGHASKKDILTLEEIKLLADTPTESGEVKRAFLFSCMTGLRWIDVSNLKWQNVNLTTVMPIINITQTKTNIELSIKLNATAIKLLGETKGKAGGKVFDLPTANGANKTLKAWVKRAGIEKAITWHNARHSFGTNLIFNEVDVLTASKLLGHTSLKHTQRYVAASEEMKQNAVDKINFDL
jgi:integrase/recombinase XerD